MLALVIAVNEFAPSGAVAQTALSLGDGLPETVASPGIENSGDAAASGEERPQGPTIEVRSRGSVTVVGRFASLRDVIEQLCRQGDVRLRTYTARDREVVASYEDVSLRQAFERLLAHESFALGFKKSAGDEKARITWIRVVASEDARGPSERKSARAVFPREALVDARAPVRRNAALDFVRRMRAEPELREALLRMSDAALARQLADEPFADEFLVQLQSQARDPRIRAKMARLRARLTAR